MAEGRSHPKPNVENPTYKKVLFAGDEGRWTIIRVTEEPIAMAYSESGADHLIQKLERLDQCDS